jgi:hypothetical protein
VTLESTGSVAAIYSRISPSSPATGQQVVNATSGNTISGVTLGAFSLKSTNNSSTLNTLVVGVTYSSASISGTFSNFRLFVNGSSVGSGSLDDTANTVTFSNMTVPLAQDTWVDVSFVADIAGASSGTVYLTLAPTTSTVGVTDANYATPTVVSGTKTSNTLTLTSNSVAVTNTSAALGAAIVQSNSTTGYNATYAFTLTNNSNNDLYVGATPSTAVTTVLTGSTGTTTGTQLSSVTVNLSTVNGDDTYTLAIPAGASRTFTYQAVLKGTTGVTILKASSINYSTAPYTAAATTAGTVTNLGSGLSSLSLTANF